MEKGKSHMSLDDRLKIQGQLEKGKSISETGKLIGKDRSTVSREVQSRSTWQKIGAPYKRFNDCRHRSTCRIIGNCADSTCSRSRCSYCENGCGPKLCDEYEKEDCRLLKSSPHVCNGCTKRSMCTLEKHLYDAVTAQKDYRELLVESREGVAISEDEAVEIGKILSNGILNGQSFYHIVQSNMPRIQYSERSLYTYTEKGVFKDFGSSQLPRKIRYRKRKPTNHDALKIDKKCRIGRSLEDYKAFRDENPDEPIVEMDCVESTKGDIPAAILTLHFTNVHLQLGFLLQHKNAAEVKECFDGIKLLLGKDSYKLLLGTLLTDNGTEFSDPASIEEDTDGELVTRIFYCDPRRSEQKGRCEKNHEHIRSVIPKGTAFSSIGLTQEKVKLMMSHVNSFRRRKDLGGRTPFEAFELFYGEGLLEKLGIQRIPDNDVLLKPRLLK